MDNLFYVPADQIDNTLPIKIEGQEAKHISRVLRYKEGDKLHVADGKGNVYYCEIRSISKGSVLVHINEIRSRKEPEIRKVLALGIIKKRDRLEFAIEKAVELGAWEICMFQAEHSERNRLNMDRIRTIALSAFKQSKRSWLPDIIQCESLEQVFNQYKDHRTIMAAMDAEEVVSDLSETQNNLLLVGPEGGFSEKEISLAMDKNAKKVSLGPNRLRAETAVTALLSQFLYTS